MRLDLPSTIFLAKGFSLTEKIQDEIGSGPNAVSAFYCIGADVLRRCGVDPYVAKMPEANIQAILAKFIVNVIRQVRQKRIYAKRERIVTNYVK